MYGKEEAQKMRQQFWTTFGKLSGIRRNASGKYPKWISYRTGIQALQLKFDMTRKEAYVGIDIDSASYETQEKYFNKLLSLKSVLNSRFDREPMWDSEFKLENDKYICRIYHKLEDVGIYRKETWGKTFDFFYKYMTIYEDFYIEFYEIIKEPEDKGLQPPYVDFW